MAEGGYRSGFLGKAARAVKSEMATAAALVEAVDLRVAQAERAKNAWRAIEGRGPFRQTRVDPGGSGDQRLPKAPPIGYRHPWGVSVALQDPEWYHESMRRLRTREPTGASLSHETLVHVPRSRYAYLVRPGVREKAETNRRRHIDWRDNPTRFLSPEQQLRVQMRSARLTAAESLPPLVSASRSAPALPPLRFEAAKAPIGDTAAAIERVHPRAWQDDSRRGSCQRVLHVGEGRLPLDLIASGAVAYAPVPTISTNTAAAPLTTFEVNLSTSIIDFATVEMGEPAWSRLRSVDSLESSVDTSQVQTARS